MIRILMAMACVVGATFALAFYPGSIQQGSFWGGAAGPWDIADLGDIEIDLIADPEYVWLGSGTAITQWLSRTTSPQLTLTPHEGTPRLVETNGYYGVLFGNFASQNTSFAVSPTIEPGHIGDRTEILILRRRDGVTLTFGSSASFRPIGLAWGSTSIQAAPSNTLYAQSAAIDYTNTILIAVSSGSTVTHFYEGANVYASPSTSGSAGTPGIIDRFGRVSSLRSTAGVIHRHVVIGRALTAGEINMVRQYAIDRWGVNKAE